MSLEKSIRDLLESTYPGFGKNREAAPAAQGSSNPNPEKTTGATGPGVKSNKSAEAGNTLAPHAAGGDATPPAQGNSNTNPDKDELDTDAPGKTASTKAKKAPGLKGTGQSPNLDVVNGVDPSVVINQPNSSGNVHRESTEELDFITDEEYEALTPEEQAQYELVEFDFDDDDILEEEMTEEEVDEFLDMAIADEELSAFFEQSEETLTEATDDAKNAVKMIRTAMANKKAGKGLGVDFKDLSKAANSLTGRALTKAIGGVDASKGKSKGWRPKDVNASSSGVVRDGAKKSTRSAMSQKLLAKYPAVKVEQTNVASIFGEGVDLSEEFVTRATNVFEAVVTAKVTAIKEELETLATEALQEAIEEHRQELSEKIDQYISYAAQSWIEENKLAVVDSLRAEVAEDFMSGLRSLFIENYIAIPEDKADVFESLQAENEALEAKINEKIQESMELVEQLNELKKTHIFSSLTEGMAVSEVEKFRTISQYVTFESDETYTKKMTAIKENYFGKNSSKKNANDISPETLNGTEAEGVVTESHDPQMEKYLRALGSKANFSSSR